MRGSEGRRRKEEREGEREGEGEGEVGVREQKIGKDRMSREGEGRKKGKKEEGKA